MEHNGVIYRLKPHGFFLVDDQDQVSFHWTSNDGDTFVDDMTNQPIGRLILLGQHTLEREVIETINRVEEAKCNGS